MSNDPINSLFSLSYVLSQQPTGMCYYYFHFPYEEPENQKGLIPFPVIIVELSYSE